VRSQQESYRDTYLMHICLQKLDLHFVLVLVLLLIYLFSVLIRIEEGHVQREMTVDQEDGGKTGLHTSGRRGLPMCS
jgi:hypothetical protein